MKKRGILAFALALLMAFGCLSALADPPVQTEGITVPEVGGMKKFEVPENEALALIRDMKSGWNLGNTFDAYDGYTRRAAGTGLESYWTRATTSRELIQALHEAGINTLRMPVSWHNHVDEQDQIDPVWMNRVKEVAGWALDLGMYVIVNVHHDNDVLYFYPDDEHMERSRAYLSAIWTQMAEAFRDWGDHLILESMNEPRLVGTSYEWMWDGKVPACAEAAENINELNQLFVDIVRASGGNNGDRYLAVPGYCASPYTVCDEAFRLPEDSADNRIIVAAHAYTPYNFALNESFADKTFELDGNLQKKAEISTFLNALYERFVSKGIPVLMDEFGARDKDGNLQDRVNFTAYYVAAASTRGMTCVWWDNHCFAGNGERFGLIDRNQIRWVYPDIVLAMEANCLYNR